MLYAFVEQALDTLADTDVLARYKKICQNEQPKLSKREKKHHVSPFFTAVSLQKDKKPKGMD